MPFSIASGNALLAGLSKHDLRMMASRLRSVELESGKVLHEWGKPVLDVYFPITAVISLLAASSEGSLIEAAVVGSEGIVGFPAAMTRSPFPFRAVVQIAGKVGRVSGNIVATILYHDQEMQRHLGAYVNVLMVQLAQSAICNNRHTVEQRLARWLLATRARTRLTLLPMTHELLSNVLGTTRPMVTIAARTLKKADLIAYRRGIIQITNPAGLAQAACPCYEIVHRELAAFLKLCDFKSHPFLAGDASRFRADIK